MSDCHIGGWQEEKLTRLSIDAFGKAIDLCIKENVAFILIAGDLFNTALPQINLMRDVANILRKVRKRNVSVYLIPGSHDFSYSGKTMLEVFEKAGLVNNVMKFRDEKLVFTRDKTNVKIAGLLGRKSGLDRYDYEKLDKTNLETEEGFKIFMFHSLLKEYLPKGLEKADAMSVNLLPKNFDYYAGGHPHFVLEDRYGKGILTYPGPLFPNNFKEFEDLKHGGFYIVDDNLNIRYLPIKLKRVISVVIDANDKTPSEIENEVISKCPDADDCIITMRVEGTLRLGRPSDIDFKGVYSKLGNTYCILKNISKLVSKEYEDVKTEVRNVDEIEKEIINKSLSDLRSEIEANLVRELISTLYKEKLESERNIDFEDRIVKDAIKVLKIEGIF